MLYEKLFPMKTVITAIVVFGFMASVFGQGDVSNDILLTSAKRNGVYKTYSEFRTNAPSITGQFEVTRHRIRLLNEKTGKYENMKGDFWGACLNDTIFVFMMQPATQQSRHLYPLEFLGRYCYLSDSGTYAQMNGGGMYTASYHTEYVVNINNGQLYKLDKKLMRAILEKDPELLAAFEEEETKVDVFKEYIIRINERRLGDIRSVE